MKDWNTLFDYDSMTGNLVWKRLYENKSNAPIGNDSVYLRVAGKVAGSKNYRPGGIPKSIRISVFGRATNAHRIIWEMHHGPVPDGMWVDHINGDPFDNRLNNLRLATPSQNNMNAGMQKNKKVKLVGVRRTREGWTTSIMANGVRYPLGSHKTKGEAAVAYAKASLRYHGSFSPFMRKAIVAQ